MAQTIDQVMRIKTHTESSKSELSSRGKRPFKVSAKISAVGENFDVVTELVNTGIKKQMACRHVTPLVLFNVVRFVFLPLNTDKATQA